MDAKAKAVSVVLLASLLSGCTAGAPSGSPVPALTGVVLAAEPGSELGNARPTVSYDGLMVRRRIAVAVHPAPDADVVKLRAALLTAADGADLVVSDISPDVLDAETLDHIVPELIVALPAGATVDDGGRLVDLAFGHEQAFPGLDHVHIASVLVHDLRFTVASADPDAVAGAIDVEGILSDALGNYQTHAGDGELELSYTGPLLSDLTIQAVREGIARGAGILAGDVKVSPRSSTGTGVDMKKEPQEASVAEDGTHSGDNAHSGHED